MKTIITALLLFFCLFQATAQETDSKFRKNVFVEGFGNGIGVSLNYDMRLKKGQQDGSGFRAGVGGITVDGTNIQTGEYARVSLVTIPLGYNYLVGKRRSSFEFGAGITTVYASYDGFIDSDFISGSGWTAGGFLNAGYRFQPIRNGVMFRAAWTPAITNSGFFGAFFGLSLGYSFK